VAQQPSDSDSDTKQILQELSAAHAKRQEQSRWLMYLVGLLILIAVVGFLLVKQ
jgi:predicted nucleic acid-binding Zn ribbon protein